MMNINQYEVWIADLNPTFGTEAGKTRPVVILQTNLLNMHHHSSTIVCPITTNTKPDVSLLRVHLKKGIANLLEDCDIMIDQIRTIDNKRLIKKIGNIPQKNITEIKTNISNILDL